MTSNQSPDEDGYISFLKAKVKLAESWGHDVSDEDLPALLKPHQVAATKWLVKGGRRALFASFGLGKTMIQLVAVKLTMAVTGGMGLIIIPLGVRQEFFRDAALLGIPVKFIRRIEETAGEPSDTIFLTNYETVRDRKLDPAAFTVASLDEASCLRGFGGTKTFREFMKLFTGDAGPGAKRNGTSRVTHRFVATATPSPNDYIELLSYAAFLGIMDVSQAKTRFFKRDSTKADVLTLHPHKEREFWLWVASWALFISKPSDLGFSDEGYELPPMDVRWHEVASDHSTAGADATGQGRLFRESSLGVTEAASEKRDSLPARLAKLMELRAEVAFEAPPAETLEHHVIDRALSHIENFYVLRRLKKGVSWSEAFGLGGSSEPVFWDGHGKGITIGLSTDEKRHISVAEIMARVEQWKEPHRILWHDLESERHAIEKAIPSAVSIYGSQDLDEREQAVVDFSDGKFAELAAKPVIAGSGCNFQRHCAWAIYLGIGFKFNDLIQSIHRIQRFLQTKPVRVDLIYTEAERGVRKIVERKWAQHNAMIEQMSTIMKEYGLSQAAMAQSLVRKLGVERVEVTGENYTIVNNDNVIETRGMKENSVGLILTSIPFATQYEYSPNYADFGHSDSNPEFFRQMDFLTPELLRVLQPGRIAAVHVKDRIVPGGMTGLGFQTVYPFHLDTIQHYTRHGFAYMGMKTIVTDVVRENNQTYRLGWTEQCKDSTKMGVGMPEYLLLFRKPPTSNEKSYADLPVRKQKDDYSLAKWQVDAHGFTRSSGRRLLTPGELEGLSHEQIFRLFRDHSLCEIYDFDHHVKVGETLAAAQKLPVTFMLLQPQSWSDEVWTDITRMRTLNAQQYSKGQEMHLCPMQFDLADRVIEQFSMPGEVVFDPFGGLMTVPYRAILKGRKGRGIELSPSYFTDGAGYCKAAEEQVAVPDMFAALGL